MLSGAGGGIACGACIPVNSYKDTVLDQTLYWRLVSTATEAWYRVGLLNSAALTEAIRAFNPEGEFGARHAHTLPHRFIPAFDSHSDTHQEIARLAKAIANRAGNLITQQPALGDPNKTIASRRRKLRTLLRESPEFRRLEELAEIVLGTANT